MGRQHGLRPRPPALAAGGDAGFGGYLDLDPSRPPACGWLLNAYVELRGGGGPASLGGLPLLQTALIALALLAFARQLDRLLRWRWAGTIVVVGVWANAATYEATRWVMSEALFLPAALLGLAGALAYARRGGLWTLAGCAASFALAALARNIGAAMLVIPVLLALLDGTRAAAGRRLAHAALAATVAALVLAAGVLDTHARHGRFALGSNSGGRCSGRGCCCWRRPRARAPSWPTRRTAPRRRARPSPPRRVSWPPCAPRRKPTNCCADVGGEPGRFRRVVRGGPDRAEEDARGEVLRPAERAAFAFVVAIQGTLLGTALVEAGLWRYTIHVNAMNAAIIAWLAHRALGWASDLYAAARQAWMPSIHALK